MRIAPPAPPLADIPPPPLPAAPNSRDELDHLTVALAGWGEQLRARLAPCAPGQRGVLRAMIDGATDRVFSDLIGLVLCVATLIAAFVAAVMWFLGDRPPLWLGLTVAAAAIGAVVFWRRTLKTKGP